MQPIKTAFLFILIVTLAIACSKDDNKKVKGAGYIDRWQLIATKVSPGFLVTEWTEQKNSKEFIRWIDSSRFSGRHQEQLKYAIYPYPMDVDTTALWMKTWVPGGKDTINYYFDIINKDTLILDGHCIEGCLYKYVRVGH